MYHLMMAIDFKTAGSPILGHVTFHQSRLFSNQKSPLIHLGPQN